MNHFRILTSVMTLGAVLQPALAAHPALRTLYNIPGSDDGSDPQSALIKVGGALYGTTGYGGKYLSGSLFKLDPVTGATKTLYSFTGGSDGAFPCAALVNVGGILYGTAETGGDPQGYTNGYTNGGTVFSFDPNTGEEKTLYNFNENRQQNGTNPRGALISFGNMLYGTASYGGPTRNFGTVFKVDPATGATSLVYAFGDNADDGSNPEAGLTGVQGNLYGTTYYGGGSDRGTVFKIDPATGSETILSNLGGSLGANPYAAMISIGGKLYGSTDGGALNYGTIYKVDPTTGATTLVYTFTGKSDGAFPGSLTNVGGIIYGTSPYMQNDYLFPAGLIFSVNPVNGAETVVYRFGTGNSGPPDGLNPNGLLDVDGILFGTTSMGGVMDTGTAFSLNPNSGVETQLHGFTGADKIDLATGQGYQPWNTLIYSLGFPYRNSGLINVGNKLYGAAPRAGKAGLGSVFSVDITTGAAKTLYEFTGGIGGYNSFGSLLDVGQYLYGTTFGSGNSAAGPGTVFKIDRATGAETTLYSFTGEGDGANPAAPLIKVGASLYGTTYDGAPTGASSAGTIFRVDPSSGAQTTLYSFLLRDGQTLGGLLNVGGLLYGTGTQGLYTQGSIYSYNPATGAETDLYYFGQNYKEDEGNGPGAALINVGGLLYGTTLAGGDAYPRPGHNVGTIFSFNPSNNQEISVYSFSGDADGAAPVGGLVRLKGALYGTTSSGGTAQNGTVFKFVPKTNKLITLYSFTGAADGGSPQATLVDVDGVLYGTTSFGGADGHGTVFSLTP